MSSSLSRLPPTCLFCSLCCLPSIQDLAMVALNPCPCDLWDPCPYRLIPSQQGFCGWLGRFCPTQGFSANGVRGWLIVEAQWNSLTDVYWPKQGSWTIFKEDGDLCFYHGSRRTLWVQKCLGTTRWSLGQEDPLEKEMATHSSILAWEIPWTEETGRDGMAVHGIKKELVTT